MATKEHTLGETRYLTYELHFPKDGDLWRKQIPFWGPLSTWLKLTTFAKRSDVCVDLLRSGESRWRDFQGVLHKVSIDQEKKEERWGTAAQKKGLILK